MDADGDRIMTANAALQAAGGGLSDWGGEPLKRVPKPFDQDHPHTDLLKRKSMTASIPVDLEIAMERPDSGDQSGNGEPDAALY